MKKTTIYLDEEVDLLLGRVAARFRTVNLLTTDQRHFRALRPLYGGEAFHLALVDD